MKNIFKYGLFIAFVALTAVNFTSCEKDEGGGIPEIQYVRITRPDAADSTFTGTHTGTTIAIIGKNLSNVQKVFINDQQVSFNPNMNTDHSVIVTIPSEENGFILTNFDPDLKPEIRVETSHGNATYHFDVYYPSPEIKEAVAEVYPAQTGGKINVSGRNFVDLKRVYFTNVNPFPAVDEEVPSTAVEITVPTANWEKNIESHRYLDVMTKKYITESTLWFNLPDLPRVDDIYSGYLVIEGPDALASIKFSTLPPPTITALSSDMPIPGATLVITGKDFIEVESVNINNGEFVILPEEMTVTSSSISFVMPAKPGKTCTLSITALGGTVTMEGFYPYETLVTNMDRSNPDPAGDDLFWSWSAVPYKESPEVNSDGICAVYSGKPGLWWWEPILNAYHFSTTSLPSFDIIPANTPVSKLELVWECYIEKFDPGLIFNVSFPKIQTNETEVDLSHNMSGSGRIQGNWHAITVPFTSVGISAATYEDFINTAWDSNDDRGIMWRVYNTDAAATPEVQLYIDNVRIRVVE